MSELPHIWQQDWPERIEDRVKAIGFQDMTALLADMPAQPNTQVAARLGDVAPIQVISLQFREAKLTGRVQGAASDNLIRNLVEELPNGWGVGDKANWQAVLALSNWSSELKVTGRFVELSQKLGAISDAIRKLPPPNGWLPKSTEDPILDSVFRKYWP